jgi:hypothetical protein
MRSSCSDAVQQLDLVERILGQLSLNAERAHQLLPLRHRVVDVLERLRRRQRSGPTTLLDALQGLQRGSVVGLNVEHVAIQLDGTIDIPKPLLVQLCDPVLIADCFRRIAGELRFVRQDREQLCPILGRLVQHVQTTERSQIIRIELQHLLVGIDRAWHVLELALVDRAHLVIDVLLLVGGLDQVRLLELRLE